MDISTVMNELKHSTNGTSTQDATGPAPVAYFSMEVGLDAAVPTYGGGLGILAGDTLRGAADLGLPMVGVTLLYRQGYLKQILDENGNQSESAETWYPEEHLEALPQRVGLTIEGRRVMVRAWRYLIHGAAGHTVPVFFLDTDLHENNPEDRALTGGLYGGDLKYRLRQEAVLGLGGIGMLRVLGYRNLKKYHMNEGHSALLSLTLLQEWCCERGLFTFNDEGVEAVRRLCVFTTHTPVAAGHDAFPMELVRRVLGDLRTSMLSNTRGCRDGYLSMSHLALDLSGRVNGVSRRHGEVSRFLYPEYSVTSITNGVHAGSWVSDSFAALYDAHVPDWRRDSCALEQASQIPLAEIHQAHLASKSQLLEEVGQRTGLALDPNVMTLGFARRAAAYKRADLLFADIERLKRITREVGPIQVLYAGKAHPADTQSKDLIRRVFYAAATLRDSVRVIYLANHDMALGKLLCSGVDLWLNTPQKPMEASGTSGMKAALNGVPSFSILDGWWVEGHQEGVTGWSIGSAAAQTGDSVEEEAASLYEKLADVLLPMFYDNPEEFLKVRRSAIAINGAYFNTHRMVREYDDQAYRAVPGSPVVA
ncbi:MAG TPA: alpha-glucan family phosphorylase [Dehalococcoidia bacterium]|nr:alpha-glucan family phosphorylase [Dehalococcoidia bacterium]